MALVVSDTEYGLTALRVLLACLWCLTAVIAGHIL